MPQQYINPNKRYKEPHQILKKVDERKQEDPLSRACLAENEMAAKHIGEADAKYEGQRIAKPVGDKLQQRQIKYVCDGSVESA